MTERRGTFLLSPTPGLRAATPKGRIQSGCAPRLPSPHMIRLYDTSPLLHPTVQHLYNTLRDPTLPLLHKTTLYFTFTSHYCTIPYLHDTGPNFTITLLYCTLLNPTFTLLFRTVHIRHSETDQIP